MGIDGSLKVINRNAVPSAEQPLGTDRGSVAGHGPRKNRPLRRGLAMFEEDPNMELDSETLHKDSLAGYSALAKYATVIWEVESRQYHRRQVVKDTLAAIAILFLIALLAWIFTH